MEIKLAQLFAALFGTQNISPYSIGIPPKKKIIEGDRNDWETVFHTKPRPRKCHKK